MSTDRELLELAAKAAGYVTWDGEDVASMTCPAPTGSRKWWNPLTDDGDALRLAHSLGMDVDMCACWVQYEGRDEMESIEFDGGPLDNVRRAIVRAAASIGRGMP